RRCDSSTIGVDLRHRERRSAIHVAADQHQWYWNHIDALWPGVLWHGQRSALQRPVFDAVEHEWGTRPGMEHRSPGLLHRAALGATALGSGLEPAAALHHAVCIPAANGSTVPILGAHLYPGHGC